MCFFLFITISSFYATFKQNTLNQLFFASEIFCKVRESFVVANFSRRRPVFVVWCYNNTGLDRAWSRRLVVAIKSWFTVDFWIVPFCMTWVTRFLHEGNFGYSVRQTIPLFFLSNYKWYLYPTQQSCEKHKVFNQSISHSVC